MKLSIAIAHFNRKKILYKSLQAYSLSENINDCEFVIVDDCSNQENRISDIKSDFPSLNIKLIEIDPADKSWVLPTFPFNLALKAASCEMCLLTNPECLPMGDVLKDVINTLKENVYQVYGCYSVNKIFTYRILNAEITTDFINDFKKTLPLETEVYLLADGQNAWYQHSIFRSLNYCFCAAMFKKDFEKINYLNDVYASGKGYGDDDLVLSVAQKNIEIVRKDSPFVLHLNHYDESGNSYLSESLALKNAEIFKNRKEGKIYHTDIFNELYTKYLKRCAV